MTREPDVLAAVEHARDRAEVWGEVPIPERLRVLRSWRARLWRDAEQLAGRLVEDAAMPLDDALLEVVQAVEHLKWLEEHTGRVLATTTQGGGLLNAEVAQRTRRLPVGVVGVVAAGAAPFYGPLTAISAALAAGNAVVVLGPPSTREALQAAVALFPLARPAVLYADGGRDAALVLADAAVDHMVVFGGPRRVAGIAARCARDLVPVTGVPVGAPITVVAPDADVEVAARAVAAGLPVTGGGAHGEAEVFVAPGLATDFTRALRSAWATRTAQEPAARAAVGGRGLVRALGARTGGGLLRHDGEGAPGGDGLPPVRLHVETELPELVDQLRARPHAQVTVFSRRRGEAIGTALRAAQVTVNLPAVRRSGGGLPRAALRADGYGPLAGDQGLLTLSRAVTTRQKRRLPVPTGPAEALLATPPGRAAARLAMHLRHSLD